MMVPVLSSAARVECVSAARLPALSACAAEFYAATAFVKRFQFDRFCHVWETFIASGAGVIFGLVDGDEIVGMLGGIALPEIYSGDLIASEFFWFVRDGYRGDGMRLYNTFEAWAISKDCVEIRMAALSDLMPERMDRLYKRLGFKLAERHFVKELP